METVVNDNLLSKVWPKSGKMEFPKQIINLYKVMGSLLRPLKVHVIELFVVSKAVHAT